MKYTNMITNVAFLLLSLGGVHAQQNTTTAGGDATGTGGTSSYTVGQVVYETTTTNMGSVAQGVQHSFAPIIATIIIQENDTGFCGVEGIVESEHAGFTGIGFANGNKDINSGVNWAIEGAAGLYTLTWRYASGYNRPATLRINGTALPSTVAFDATNGWATWNLSQSVTVSLAAGTKAIRLQPTVVDGLVNIDYFEVTGPNVTAATCGGASFRNATPASSTAGIAATEAAKEDLSLYPNPVNQHLHLRHKQGGFIQLYNNLGYLLYSKELVPNQELLLDMSTLAAGWYVVTFTNNGQVVSHKVIKR